MLGMVADINARGLDNWSALHFAAHGGHKEIIKELFNQPGMEVEPLSNSKRTPLHIAAMQGHSGIVEMLIHKGVNTNCKDDDENTPLHLAS